VARILIVDDEPDLVAACTMALEAEGHSVASVTNGRQALPTAEVHHPDLVMLDWVMPGCDGGAVLAQLRASLSMAAVRVMVMSALPDGAARARAAGADAFLAKPFDGDELAREVATLLVRAAR
jgi:DNA-binding response OmpR family regulator